LLVYSDTQSEEACNHEYYDHDADYVEDVHCALLLRTRELKYEHAPPIRNVSGLKYVPR